MKRLIPYLAILLLGTAVAAQSNTPSAKDNEGYKFTITKELPRDILGDLKK